MSSFQTLARIKYVANLLVSFSVGFVVNSFLKQNTTASSPFNKVRLAVGAFAISGMVATKAVDWANDEIDTYFVFWQQMKQIVKPTSE